MPLMPAFSWAIWNTESLACSTAACSVWAVMCSTWRMLRENTSTASALATSPALCPPMPSATAQKRSPSAGA